MRARLLLLRLALASGVAVSVVSLVPASLHPAAAQTPGDDDSIALISPDLAAVRVEGGAANAAQAAFDDTLARLDAAIAARTGADAELVMLAARDVQLTAGIVAETALRKAAALALVEARAAVQAAAVSSYVVSTTYDELSRVLDVESNVEIGRVLTYGDAAREDRQLAELASGTEVQRASQALDAMQLERIAARVRAAEVTAARDTAAADEVTFTAELAVRTVERDRAKATSRVAGVDFTLVALDAYWRGAASQAECGVQWWALAGISRVEGRHGTYGGSTLRANGDVTRPIIGIPLSGAANTAVVSDTDGGALDGDAVHDRAVGPMQFIPSTWARWGRDGDDDGDVDPQNLYDAAAAAAAYLCAGRNLDTEEGIRAGYFSYNRSQAYVETVLAHAYAYRELVIPAPPAIPRRLTYGQPMAFRSIDVTEEVFEYLVAHGTPSDETYDAIREETEAATGPFAGMQIGADQYALLTLLARLTGVQLAVEVGTFTGTSAVAIARGLAPGGRLVCCDISEEWTAIARRHWASAGVADSIDLRVAPALDTLAGLPAEPPVDFAFVDADKPGYVDYYEAIVPRLRAGGLLIADNVLWSGKVADPSVIDENTVAIRRFNDHVATDDRCDTVMLAVGDGITLCRKR